MKPILALLLPYLAWLVYSLALFFLPGPLGFLAGLLSITGFFVFLAFLLEFCLNRIEPLVGNQHRLRGALLGAGLAIFLFCWLIPWFTGSYSPVLAGFNSINLLVSGALIGGWMAFPLKQPRELLPLCLVACLADIVSILSGPTRDFSEAIAGFYQGGMRGDLPFVDHILIKMPVPDPQAFMPLFGVSDWIIVVFLSAAALKFGMNDSLFPIGAEWSCQSWFRMPAALAGLILPVVLVRIFGVFLPALPFVAGVFILYTAPRHRQMLRLTRAEILPMVAAVAIAAALMLWLPI